jgi:hypothetical protein
MPSGRITNQGVTCSVGEFIADCCQAIPGMFTSNADLYATFKAWMHTRGKTPIQGLHLAANKFGQVFQDQCRLGVIRGRHREDGTPGCGWRGLWLRQTTLDLPDCPQADLATLIDRWNSLPQSVRAKIVTIAKAIGKR